MDFRKKFRRLATIVVMVSMLSGCLTRHDVFSKLVLAETGNIDQTLQEVTARMVAHGESIGLTCETFLRGTHCRNNSSNSAAEVTMDTGLTRDGNVYLRVHTSSTFWIGKDEERLIAGDFLPQLHLDWEAWMRGLENEFPYLSRERSLSGSDLRRSF